MKYSPIKSNNSNHRNRVGTTLYVYDYDSFGQLIYERDYIQNLSRQYDFDEGGNLRSETKKYYDGSNDSPTRTETINYGYSDTNWTDKMTSYNGQTITYDEIGNPLSYRDGMTMTWQNGRQLASLQKGNNDIQYSYDSEGIRVSKTINGEKCTFEYLNGMLLYETRGEKYFHYYYDSNGTLCAVNYRLTQNGTDYTYYYTHNWRGDIVGIYNGNGDLRAKYTYDSWGNVTSITDGNGNAITDQNHIANLNPFRYRGYYMDTETGMYYLMSRYYDPVTHRFVNADGYFQTGTGVLDANMNAYCGNNPIMNYDPTGLCYVAQYTNVGTYIGTKWVIKTAVPGVPGFCYDCKQYNPYVSPSTHTNTAVTESDTTRSSYLVTIGVPNSKSYTYNSDGTVKRERWYGPDGLPIRDRDYNHPGNMDFPHDHEWINGQRSKEHLEPSPEYEFAWDFNPFDNFKFDMPYYYNPPTGERPFWETIWQYFSTLE